MQHHVHTAPRNAPHIRPSYHHMATTMPPMPVATPTTVAPPPVSQTQQSQQHMRELSNTRLKHHHQQQQHHHPNTTQTLHSSSTNQMQKIRQQHQHLNSNPNKITTVLPTNQPPPPYNSNTHTSHQQQQHQQQHQHLTPYNVGHFNQLAAATHQQHMAHVSSYPSGPPIHSGIGIHPTHQHQHQHPHHYYVTNKAKYNNNSNNPHINTNYAPKSILQNPNRPLRSITKSKIDAHSKGGIVVVSADTGTDATKSSCHSNNIIITPEAMPTIPEVTVALEHTTESPPSSSSAKATVTATSTIPTEKTTTTTTAATESVEDANNAEDTVEHQIGATLANEDSSVPRNSKDKTPMCLVNELARFNKISHQYRLTGERGPAHSKTFTVTLRLGNEEYSADGFKIKKAQHLAAAKAIEETKFKHPPPKARHNEECSGGRMNITPTVELNALAMKLGQRTYYLLDPTQIPPPNAVISPDFVAQPGHHMLPQVPPVPHVGASGGGGSYMRRNGNFVPGGAGRPPAYLQPGMPAPPLQRFAHRGYPSKYPPRYPLPPQMGGHMVQSHGPPFAAPLPTTPSKITLFVGKQKFVGIGRTLQQAKHDAAARALQLLKSQAKTTTNEDSLDDSTDEGDKKSPISQVHEIGIKRSMTVHFKVLREEGPAHMKNFITACIVGSIVTEGEGNGKKLSKKRSAEKMLTELKKLPPMTPTNLAPLKRIRVKTPGKPMPPSSTAATPNPKGERRKRLGAPLKDKTAEVDDSENPITKLIQLQQSRKEKEPVFEMIAKNGNENSRRREFIMEVSAGSMVARGTGNNKKLAKRSAAQNLLNLMEEPTNDNKENAGEQTTQLKTTSNVDTAAVPALAPATPGAMAMAESKKMDVPMISTPAGPVPGILIIRQNKKHAAKKKESSASAKPTNVETIPTKQDEPIEGGDTKTNNSTTSKSTTNEATTTQNSSANTPSSTTNITQNNNDNSKTSTATAVTTSLVTDTSDAATSETTLNKPDGNASSTKLTATNGNNVASVHMKEQLLYLAKLLGFEVNFSDYPKGNHNEFLTIVTLSSDPPQICHGVGSSAEESQNDAAKSALKILSELGLNNAKNGKK